MTCEFSFKVIGSGGGGGARVTSSQEMVGGPYRQLVAFSEPRHRATDPATSAQAAAAVGERAECIESRILKAYRSHPSLTDDELCALLPDAYAPTVKSARSRLSNRGRLVPTGARRPSTRGRDMVVWAVAS